MAPTTAVSPSAPSSSETDSAASSASRLQQVSSRSYVEPVEDSADSQLPDTSKKTPEPKSPKSAAKPQPSASGTMRESGRKRPAGRESKLVNASKKAKKNGKNDGDGEAKPKVLFQRVWSKEEEITLIKAMIDYTRAKHEHPDRHSSSFYLFIKGTAESLSSKFLKNQVQDKVQRMKKKFLNILNDRFKSPGTHDLLAFELMKSVWGDAQNSDPEQPKSINGKGRLTDDSFSILLDKGFKALGVPYTIVKQGLELADEKKRAELKERWIKFHLAELELYAERMAIMGDQARLISDAVKTSDRVS